jgi:hypothetical protein
MTLRGTGVGPALDFCAVRGDILTGFLERR